MKKTLIPITLFITLLSSSILSAQNDRVVRFWEGISQPETKLEDHIGFIRDTLAPATVSASIGLLEHYVLYIPTQKIPANAYNKKLTFTEAAIPTYTNAIAYDKRGSEYGAIHFIKNGFQKTVSYSSTPSRYDGSEYQIEISDSKEKTAYDLRPYSLLSQRNSTFQYPNWQKGTSVAWLILRKKDSKLQDYLSETTVAFDTFIKDIDFIDGHYARVAEGHTLHFMNFVSTDAKTVKKQMKTLEDLIKDSESIISFEMDSSVAITPFSEGWKDAFQEGKVVNIQFAQPGTTIKKIELK